MFQISSISSSLTLWTETFRSHWSASALFSCCSSNQSWTSKSGPWISCTPYCHDPGLLPVLNYDISVWLVLDGFVGSLFDLWLHERSEGGHDAEEDVSHIFFALRPCIFYDYLNIFNIQFFFTMVLLAITFTFMQ